MSAAFDKFLKDYSIGAIYQDEYKRNGNDWLIAKRTGNFQWQYTFNENFSNF